MDECISVIVPIYNVERYLEKCIDSIITQTYKNIEIILVNDGSPDRSAEICEEYKRKDNRIKVIYKENGGLSSARNVGFQKSSGAYVIFIDSDDYIHPEMIEKMYEATQKESADMCICGVKWVNEDGSDFTNVLPCPIKNCTYTSKDKNDVFLTPAYFYYVTAWNKLYKRQIFEKIQFPVGKRNEDEYTVHHIFDACSKIVCVENILYYYVQRRNSIMHSELSEKNLDAVEALLDRAEFFKAKKLPKQRKYAVRQAYGALYTFISKADVLRYKAVITPYIRKVSKLLGFDLRRYKLCLKYVLKNIRGILKYIFAKLDMILSVGKKGNRCVIIATPTHGNLGDHAIVLAEKKILRKIYPEKKIVEIPNDTYIRFPELCKQYITAKDILVIDGGGNLGSIWKNEDDKISNIISDFKDNKIRIFPQTCYYNMQEDVNRIRKNREVYANAANLSIMLRDKRSFDVVQELFPEVRAYFVPDIVFSLHPKVKVERTKKVLICFRTDVEKKIKDEDRIQIEKYLSSNHIPYEFVSTLINKRVNKYKREAVLNEKWGTFSSAQLVITDRLHAMIFSAITQTPCIAVDNLSRKVSGAYDWIHDLDYISFVKDINEVLDLIPNLLSKNNCVYSFEYPERCIKEIMK